MPLRYIRRKVTAEHVVTVAVGTAATATNMAALASFPPVALPAAILLKIFEIIRDVQTNQQQCYDLAQRCHSFLDLVRDQIADHRREAPPSLINALQKFTETLQSIYVFLTTQVRRKWAARLVHKGSVQSALEDLNSQLDDAFSAFQMATLVNIHYTLGDGPISGASSSILSAMPSEDTADGAQAPVRQQSVDEVTLIGEITDSPPSGNTRGAEDAEEEPEVLDDYGFFRYSSSDVSIKGESRIEEGWWAESRPADVKGRSLIVKNYGDTGKSFRKDWIRDVKILRNIFHPNLPQMVGFSAEECPTPFIVLANVQTRLPQALVLDKIRHGTVAESVQLISRFYLDHMDAALYLQRQLALSDSKIQDYVENASYRIDGPRTLVMGLPPPEVDNVTSWRNFDLAHSVRRIYLDLLPNRGMNAEKPCDIKAAPEMSIEVQRKINHLTQMLHAVLPSSHSVGHPPKLQGLLSEYEEDGPRTAASLRNIRLASLKLGACPSAWREPLVPAYKYSVGDLGYLKEQGDFSSFHFICNVIQDRSGSVPLVQAQHGSQAQWYTTGQTKLEPFPCPGNRHGWAVAVEPNQSYTIFIAHEERAEDITHAWRFLLTYGQYYAKVHCVEPEDLILVTRVGVDLRFRLKGPFQPNLPHHLSFPQRPTPPIVFYISTSINEDQAPSWSQSPVFDPKTTPSHHMAGCMISSDAPLGFLNYVQLHAEDFDGVNAEYHEVPPSRKVHEQTKLTKPPSRSTRTGSTRSKTTSSRRGSHTTVKSGSSLGARGRKSSAS